MQTTALEVIRSRRDDLKRDERLSYPNATIVENAPLALTQLALKEEIRGLNFAVGVLEHERDRIRMLENMIEKAVGAILKISENEPESESLRKVLIALSQLDSEYTDFKTS